LICVQNNEKNGIEMFLGKIVVKAVKIVKSIDFLTA